MKTEVGNLWLSDECAHRQGTSGASCRHCTGKKETLQTVWLCKCGCHLQLPSPAKFPNSGFLDYVERAVRRIFGVEFLINTFGGNIETLRICLICLFFIPVFVAGIAVFAYYGISTEDKISLD